MIRGFALILLAFTASALSLGSPVKKAQTTHTDSVTGTAKTTKVGTSHTAAGRFKPAVHGSTATLRPAKYVRNRNGRLVRVAGRAAPAPTYQLHPDPERYQQIQQALADRGYFKGQVNGQWGDDSTDALRRFQADQKLDDDGHLSALTLTGLGLGPKHEHDLTAAPANGPPAPMPISSPASAKPNVPLAASAPIRD